MPRVVQVRDVPDDVHRALKARAAETGRTLSELVRDELAKAASTPSPAEVERRVRAHRPVRLSEPIAETVRRMRDDAA